jgi:hypothetical protein
MISLSPTKAGLTRNGETLSSVSHNKRHKVTSTTPRMHYPVFETSVGEQERWPSSKIRSALPNAARRRVPSCLLQNRLCQERIPPHHRFHLWALPPTKNAVEYSLFHPFGYAGAAASLGDFVGGPIEQSRCDKGRYHTRKGPGARTGFEECGLGTRTRGG